MLNRGFYQEEEKNNMTTASTLFFVDNFKSKLKIMIMANIVSIKYLLINSDLRLKC